MNTSLDTLLSADQCIKCNICTAACPVAAVTDRFPGPKAVGPQAQRFRQPGALSVDRSVAWCSGCGVCSRVCPHGVQIAEMNTIAKAELARRRGIPLRDRLLGRSERLGQLGALLAPLSNFPLHNRPLRWLAEKLVGVSRQAAFPRFARPTFRAWFRRSGDPLAIGVRKVLYFHGCAANYYEPRVAKAAVQVLERNGCRVLIGEQNCCGLPLQSNGEFGAARAYARANVRKLAPYVRDGYTVVGASTSCTLALKHEYQAVLGLEGEEVALLAANTYDFFEFLLLLDAEGKLDRDFRELPERVAYHPPCQLKSHYLGHPAAALLRQIPGVLVFESTAACCGVAGTYGLKAEKHEIARQVGEPLFHEIEDALPTRVACDSETCRWWIEKHTGRPVVHPVELLAEAYGAGEG